MGALIGYQKFLTGLLEIPSGFATDRWGRRRALALTFAFYVLAFPLYAVSASLVGGVQILSLYAAQTLFGLGEALRTGSHKAIMLDWADASGADATHVVGVTRFFSKASSGVSAMGGGLLLYLAGDFRWLFWASTLPAMLGVLLMLSYPGWLEGEMSAPERHRLASWMEDRATSPLGCAGNPVSDVAVDVVREPGRACSAVHPAVSRA